MYMLLALTQQNIRYAGGGATVAFNGFHMWRSSIFFNFS
jgi:hypothetical protein